MKRIRLVLLIAVVCAACAGGSGNIIEDTLAEQVPWQTALQVLYSGDVEAVYQLHNLEVTLVLKDGRELITIEPRIDEIFREIDKCGQICDQIILATE